MKTDILNQFLIKSQHLGIKDRFELIRNVYLSVLNEDESWHFFYESEMGDIIRCSPEFSGKLESWLSENNMEYNFYPFWEEVIPVVEDNLEYFSSIFHINSEFIINNALNFGDSLQIGMTLFIDRFSHSLYLNYGFSAGKLGNEESIILSRASVGRATYEGIRCQYLRDKEYMDYLKDKLESLENKIKEFDNGNKT